MLSNNSLDAKPDDDYTKAFRFKDEASLKNAHGDLFIMIIIESRREKIAEKWDLSIYFSRYDN